ncbi:MAG: B12-binding domain-containing radical SAM protein [Bacteroidales bacterium]|nr:B12-binding domain-containing radical SAM protein [Bacteroidales bacterium]
MKVLLVYPLYPDSFWSFKHALRFISKKAAVPPLGLITVSAMLPSEWQKKLVDMNVSQLKTSDIQWADLVFISAMVIQKESVDYIIRECVKLGAKIVAGGPLFTQEYQNYPSVDHFVLNEAEITLPLFLKDMEDGRVPDKVYRTDQFADISLSPVPDFHLLSMKDYAFMDIQVSRGCPYSCEFCEITTLLGNKVRMKATAQVIKELEVLYKLNWRGHVSIVDDNFIGNRHEIKLDLLPGLARWMKLHKYPFIFSAQTSINLADDDELLTMMTNAGFGSTFIGIETPSVESLHECNKVQNKNRNMLHSVLKIQRAGLLVSGGFIVGFDSDSPAVFQQQIDFIQQSGIVSAMVGLLNAPKNTKLYNRLGAENRLIKESSGNNTDLSMNFIPRMNPHELIAGYNKIIHDIYTTKPYYKRVRKLMVNYKRRNSKTVSISYATLNALIRSFLVIGILNRGRSDFWKFMIWTMFSRPGLMADAIEYSIYGYHYRTVYGLRK